MLQIWRRRRRSVGYCISQRPSLLTRWRQHDIADKYDSSTQQHTHSTHPFNGPFSATTQVSRYQKGKTNLDLLKQETVSGSGIGWAICKSAPRSRQITTPAPHQSVFYRPDALPAAQPTASKHWRQNTTTTIDNTVIWPTISLAWMDNINLDRTLRGRVNQNDGGQG